MQTRCAAKGIHLQTAVIRQDHHPAAVLVGKRFTRCVFSIIAAILDHFEIRQDGLRQN